jgi:subtilase family serine protease
LAYLGFLGRWGVFGGTSAASPAWAGIIAVVNQANGEPVGFVNQAIYDIFNSNSKGHSNVNNLPNAFHDITQGNNADCLGQCGEDGFLSGPGYDLTTGWGTPNVAVLVSSLTGGN